MLHAQFLALRADGEDDLCISGIQGRRNFYGYAQSGEYSSRTLMQFPARMVGSRQRAAAISINPPGENCFPFRDRPSVTVLPSLSYRHLAFAAKWAQP